MPDYVQVITKNKIFINLKSKISIGFTPGAASWKHCSTLIEESVLDSRKRQHKLEKRLTYLFYFLTRTERFISAAILSIQEDHGGFFCIGTYNTAGFNRLS